MSFELAIRLTEIALGWAIALQSIEQWRTARTFFSVRFMLAAGLLTGTLAAFCLLGLCIQACVLLVRFQGPYNGGSDRMGMLLIFCLSLAHWAPNPRWQELAFAYLAAQLVLSYVISGWVKVKNPAWRSGAALRDVFAFSAYPVSEDLRTLSNHPNLMFVLSWAVIGLELVFPLTLLSQPTLIGGLILAAMFHLSNALFLGLNRFFWVWLATYPSILWLHDRLNFG